MVPEVTRVAWSSASGAELVRSAGPAQGGEHVELPGLEVVRGEDPAPGPVQVTREPGDPAEHLQRLDVEVRAFRAPGLDEPVDFILHGWSDYLS